MVSGDGQGADAEAGVGAGVRASITGGSSALKAYPHRTNAARRRYKGDHGLRKMLNIAIRKNA